MEIWLHAAFIIRRGIDSGCARVAFCPYSLRYEIVEGVHPAGSVADDCRRLQRDLFGKLQLRIFDRGPRSDHRELREAIEHAQSLRIEMLRRIEIENLSRNACVQTLGRNNGDGADTGSRFDQSRPKLLAGAANRRDDADPRHDHSVHCGTFAAISFSTISATSPTVENGISWPALS